MIQMVVADLVVESQFILMLILILVITLLLVGKDQMALMKVLPELFSLKIQAVESHKLS